MKYAQRGLKTQHGSNHMKRNQASQQFPVP